jgi:hypothetical protein
MSTKPGQATAVEMLAEWQGQAVPHPGVLFDESQAENHAGAEDVAAIAGWIAVSALSGTIGNSAYDAARRKVIAFMKARRARFGHEKLDEVKKQLLVEMQTYRKNGRITEQELQERIELLFQEING